MKSANDNNRPAEFDRKIAEIYPKLRKRAHRYTRDVDVLANETIVVALHRWAAFRGSAADGYYGLSTWLAWVMRGVASDMRSKEKRAVPTVSGDVIDYHSLVSSQPAQEAYTDLRAVLMVLPPAQTDVLVRRANGESQVEIAASKGVSKQRIGQIEGVARARLRSIMNDAANGNVRRAA